MKIPFWPRRAAKASAANRLVVLGLNMPGPIEHVRFEGLSKEGYERAIAVYACVTAIMNAASTAEWVLYERAKARGGKARRIVTEGGWQRAFLKARGRKALEYTEVMQHPLLALIEKPNPAMAKSDYVKSITGNQLISGNAYEEFVAPNREKAAPLEMYSLRPDRVKVVPGPRTGEYLVAGYAYAVGGEKPEFFPADSVIHRKSFHPTDDWYGLSPLQVALRTIRTDNRASDWNYALIENQARPSGALIAPNVVGDDAYDRIKSEILESYSGNPGLPIFLEGGLEWKQLGLSPVDLDWHELKKMNRVELCSVYGVPPEIAGDAEHKTYNSMPEARKAFWMEAVMPGLDSIRDVWNLRLTPRYGDRLFLDYDRDQIDALHEDQRLLWDRVGRSDWITINEAREATGYEPSAEDGAEVPRRLLPPQQGGQPFPSFSGGPEPKAGETIPETKSADFTPAQKAAEKKMRAMWRRHFKRQGEALLERLKAIK